MLNEKFGRLLVVSQVESKIENGKKKRRRWSCICECGNIAIVETYRLRSGHTKSCGCLRSDTSRQRKGQKRTHGHFVNGKPTKLYSTWQGIKDRCLNKNNKDYYKYGGRGISVCEEWLVFEKFLDDVGEPPSKKHQLDRIDNNKSYYKGNCRWATPRENINNRNVTMNYERQSACQHLAKQEGWLFCPLCGLGYSTNPDGSKAGVNNG